MFYLVDRATNLFIFFRDHQDSEEQEEDVGPEDQVYCLLIINHSFNQSISVLAKL